MTGAMMPEGADAIVKVEDTDGGTETVEIRAGVPVGTSVRPAGEDVKQGQVVLTSGMEIDARRVALLAATGHADALVRPRPRVAIVSTGAELVPPGRTVAGQARRRWTRWPPEAAGRTRASAWPVAAGGPPADGCFHARGRSDLALLDVLAAGRSDGPARAPAGATSRPRRR